MSIEPARGREVEPAVVDSGDHVAAAELALHDPWPELVEQVDPVERKNELLFVPLSVAPRCPGPDHLRARRAGP
jgi:hypothetical protein